MADAKKPAAKGEKKDPLFKREPKAKAPAPAAPANPAPQIAPIAQKPSDEPVAAAKIESVKSTKSADAAAPKAPVPQQPSAPAAPPSPPPLPPAKPTGDAAMLYGAVGGVYNILEDGVGVLTVPADVFLDAAAETRAMGYRVLSLVSAYDRIDHFGVLYAFVKPASKPTEFGELRLRVVMPKKDAAGAAIEPRCPSLVPVFPGADWQEREMYDMYGIRFEGHPDLRRMFLPEGWHGYPMRKDNKEPEQFVAMRDGEDIVVSKPEEGAW